MILLTRSRASEQRVGAVREGRSGALYTLQLGLGGSTVRRTKDSACDPLLPFLARLPVTLLELIHIF